MERQPTIHPQRQHNSPTGPSKKQDKRRLPGFVAGECPKGNHWLTVGAAPRDPQGPPDTPAAHQAHTCRGAGLRAAVGTPHSQSFCRLAGVTQLELPSTTHVSTRRPSSPTIPRQNPAPRCLHRQATPVAARFETSEALHHHVPRYTTPQLIVSLLSFGGLDSVPPICISSHHLPPHGPDGGLYRTA